MFDLEISVELFHDVYKICILHGISPSTFYLTNQFSQNKNIADIGSKFHNREVLYGLQCRIN